jgi:hypothetical protein
MTVFIADIASYQHGLLLASLRPDCVAVEIKCTQGADYVNPDYAGWLPQARDAQLLPIAYHYVTGVDPSAQAANLAAHIGDRSLPVMLDIEQGSGDLQHALSVADAMTAAGLRAKLMYLPHWYWQQLGGPDLAGPFAARGLSLINASYPTTAPGTVLGLYPGDSSPLWQGYGGIASPALLQFTDAALEGGQRVDMNAFRGTAAALAALLGATAVPGPTPAPPWPGRTFVYSGPNTVQTHGDDVRRWQARMAWRGWRITVDGWYGAQSATVCRAFQVDSTAHGWPLVADAAVGRLTWRATWERPVSR